MSGVTGSEKPSGRLRRLLGRLVPTEERQESGHQRRRDDARHTSGCTPIRDCGDRQQVKVTGTLRTVTVRPLSGAPALLAELSDGSADLDVVWLGRRAIAGIEPGRELTAFGRVTMHRGRPVLFNPRYELRPLGQERRDLSGQADR